MNIFVGSLSFQSSEQDLHKLFSEYGTVKSVKIISDNYTGRSRGFGFVEMENTAEATKAIEQLNNMRFMEQFIVVNEAKPRSSSGGSSMNKRDSYSKDKGFSRDKRRY